jgi:hypothetical protein
VLVHVAPVAVGVVDPPLVDVVEQLGPSVQVLALHFAVQSSHEVAPLMVSWVRSWHVQRQEIDVELLLPAV